MEKYQTSILSILLESKIIQIIRKDNVKGNTVHFLWDRQPETPADYILEVVTHNVDSGKNFLLKSVNASTHTECLKSMLQYLEEDSKQDQTWNVFWRDEKGTKHLSYFNGKDEEEVRQKFFYEDDGRSEIEEIIKI